MRYRVTVLTPTLVGDGQKLSPIDYMVWKDHVNVLDQRRIFKLLAKGPRLEGYLGQLKKADKLDFASWGGFAQNFAGRRIPFEDAGAAASWNRTPAEYLFIPTFATGPKGPYLPATAIKGALRTGVVGSRWSEATVREIGKRMEGDRFWRMPALKAEESVLGGAGISRMRAVSASDSDPVTHAAMKVYLVRTSTLAQRGPKLELAWKTAPRGSAHRADDATPAFAEMAVPGTVFEGGWIDQKIARGRENVTSEALLEAANRWAAVVLDLQVRYAQTAGLSDLRASLEQLQSRLGSLGPGSCLLEIGWGGGLVSKIAANPETEAYREIARQLPFYQRAIQTGMPFPKTRKIVFQGGRPASLPGWVLLEVS